MSNPLPSDQPASLPHNSDPHATGAASSQPHPLPPSLGVNGFAASPHDTLPLSGNENDAASISGAPGSPDAQLLNPPLPGRAAWITSLITRRRSPHGDILPHSFSYEVPLVDEVPLADTAYEAALKEIEAHDPERAHTLRAFYDRRLLVTLRRLCDARVQAQEDLQRELVEAERINREVEVQHKRIEREREAALKPLLDQVEETEDALTQSHHAAAQAMARCGHPYDPALPDASGVLRHEREPLEAIAGELNEPWTLGDAQKRLPKAATLLLTALTGAVLGLSLGLMGEFYSTDELAFKPGVVLSFCVGGVGVAMLAGEGIKLFFKAVSERFYRGQEARRWGVLLGAGVLVAALIVVIDSYVERSGLMSKVFETQLMQSLSRSPSRSAGAGGVSGVSTGDQVLFFLAGMILSLPLALCYAWHGYLDGRYHICRNRLLAEQEKRFAAHAQWLREDTSTQEALDAVSGVRESLRHLELVRARLERAAQPFEREMAWWESRRRPEVRELSDDIKRRLQDLLANAHGAQLEWDRAMDVARGVPLWHLSFRQRLKLLFGISPDPVRVQRLGRNWN